jgi:hypothetical protein
MAEFDEDGFADAVESSEAITSSNVTFPQSMKEESVITELPEKDLEKAMLAKEAGNKYALLLLCDSITLTLDSLFRQKEYLEALKKYSEAIDLCPQEPQLHEQLVGCYDPLFDSPITSIHSSRSFTAIERPAIALCRSINWSSKTAAVHWS